MALCSGQEIGIVWMLPARRLQTVRRKGQAAGAKEAGKGFAINQAASSAIILPGAQAPDRKRHGSHASLVTHRHGTAKDSWFAHLAVEVPGEETVTALPEPVHEAAGGQLS